MHFNFKSVHDANPSIKHLWTTNWNNPFFLRFMIPFLSNSYYFFNIDDDLILGRNTLQTMKDVMDQKNAIPAAYGRYIRDYRFNPPFLDQKVVRPTEEMQSVDFLVVSYGLKLEYVKVFWRYRGMMVRNGEDIHLSMTNHLECNRDSVVPIKTENSSIENLGDDGVASFNKPGHMENRAILIRTWITLGYQPMKPQSLPLPVISKEMRQFYLSRLRYWTVSLTTRSASRSVTHATSGDGLSYRSIVKHSRLRVSSPQIHPYWSTIRSPCPNKQSTPLPFAPTNCSVACVSSIGVAGHKRKDQQREPTRPVQ
jgi:hypothetical protein